MNDYITKKPSVLGPAKKPRSTGPGTTDLAEKDLREQLFNEGKTGPVQLVSLPEVNITSLRGIMLDLDPDLFKATLVPGKLKENPELFYEELILPMLRRQPLLNAAEVRMTGTGLHVIVTFDEPVQFKHSGDRQRWAAIVRGIQCLLPTDFNAPGITAFTRPVGSINGKINKPVLLLKKSEAVAQSDVATLFSELCEKPFATVANVLFGKSPIKPCPVCMKLDSSLGVLNKVGKCYSGGCGHVNIEHLYDHFLKPISIGNGAHRG